MKKQLITITLHSGAKVEFEAVGFELMLDNDTNAPVGYKMEKLVWPKWFFVHPPEIAAIIAKED